MDYLSQLLYGFILVMAYLLPSIVADRRKHHQFSAIFVANLLLGWTVIGWIISLIWAFTATRPDVRAD